MLLNLEPESTLPPTPSIVPTRAIDPQTLPQSHVHRSPQDWEWQELRDYVIYKISMMTGEFSGHPSSAAAEAQIFKSFLIRYGADAQRIARYALDTCEGLWYSSPVTIFHFCKKSDPRFAEPILKSLEAAV